MPDGRGRLQYGMSKYLGVEIGGTKLLVVVGDGAGKITDRRRFGVDSAEGAAGILRQIQEGVRALQAQHAPVAVGVGFGGPVEWRSGRIARSHQIEGWSGFEMREWLERLSGLPVAVENDSNLATLAEARVGAGAGFGSVFYFNLGSGVGGGLVMDGRIVHGAPPGEAEFGHLRLDRQGTIVEERCSGWAVDRQLREYATRNPDGVLARLIGPKAGGEGKHLGAALAAGDPDAAAVLQAVSQDVGFALSHVVHLIHPEMMVLGGGLSLVGEPLRAAIEAALQPHLMEVFRPGPPLKLAEVGEDAVPVGALLLAAGMGRSVPN